MKQYLRFLWRCFRISFVGDWRYHAWMLLLSVVCLGGSTRTFGSSSTG